MLAHTWTITARFPRALGEGWRKNETIIGGRREVDLQ